jgi:hypothetical protein
MACWITGTERIGTRTVRLEDSDTLRLYQRFVTIIYLTRSLVER